jgi:hypothetical protein
VGDGFFMVEIVIFVESNFNPGGGGEAVVASVTTTLLE